MRKSMVFIALLGTVMLSACAGAAAEPTTEPAHPTETTRAPQPIPTEPEETEAPPVGSIHYLGHGSLRITTPEGKVIYIDPYAEGDYGPRADLILITHGHGDHNALGKIENRTADCRIITQREALEGGEHRVFDLDYVRVEAVEAGNNANHSILNCVGYVLTLTDGKRIYLSGDTSRTEQMEHLGEIDYAFFCCDGVYNMGPEEAAQCAQLVGAEHSIPYHTAAAAGTADFSMTNAERFTAPNAQIVLPGEEIPLL